MRPQAWATSMGDGFDDVIVGSPGYSDSEGKRRGRVQLYMGSPGGLRFYSSWEYRGALPHANLGLRVSPAGDLDGDGFDDVWISAPGSLPKRAQSFVVAGKVLLFRGSNEGLMKEPTLTIEWDQPNTRFGQAVQSLGDLDQDGTHEIGVIESRFLAADSKSQPSVAPGRLHLFSLERTTSASDPFRVVRRVHTVIGLPETGRSAVGR
jgi:hypothetical protein